MIKFNCVVFR